MKFSKSWVMEWVRTELSDNALAEQITMAGLEVDAVEAVAGQFNNVVVGEVVECAQHPDADKLRVTKVNVGEAELLDIVCGAPNCRAGLKVCVAKVGATLPGDFTIKKAKLRGQPSHGMLCSFSELGIDVEADGIIELPLDAPIGTDIREYLALNDVSIDVDLTPNRADCLGIAGLAREIGVLNSVDVVEPTWAPAAATCDATFPIRVEAPADCPVISVVSSGAEPARPEPALDAGEAAPWRHPLHRRHRRHHQLPAAGIRPADARLRPGDA